MSTRKNPKWPHARAPTGSQISQTSLVSRRLSRLFPVKRVQKCARAPSLVPRVKSGRSCRANLVLHQVATSRREKGKKPGGSAAQPFRLNQTKGWTREDKDLDGTLHSHGQSAPKGPLIPFPCCKLDVFVNRIAQQTNFSPAVNSHRR